MSGDGRLVRTLVACYPAAWRRRYGEEYAQLLHDLRIHRRPGLIADSVLGAARAHGGALMSDGVVWATGLFTVAGIGFAKLAEDFTGRATGTYALLVAAAAVALLALALAAAPALRQPGAWKYLAVPLAGAAAWYGVLRLVLATSAGHAGFLVLAAAGIAVVAATAWAATRALRQAAPARIGLLRTVAGAMAVATVAVAAWGPQVHSGVHDQHGFLATPSLYSWAAVVVALGASTAMATLGLRHRS
ncbi:hypothetical protein [Actinoplanes sp. L3-i22]|uniref:hypothetical protein n=1 Tax=Actinoplanes sp. L3-i22 TaxID=2836373 RepID=UPI001C77CDA0|nr:hypothetical protein [Actinoplanes sp. L3-i22]BCY11574.1 hypothetical protein L3i22_066620 [Actinoplanes sp. L3-i22]